MPRNNLDHETSPYLLQHRDNPVHWQAWGTEAFDLAKRDNKPVLLSVGYAACHWCHVMAHESFEDDAIAAVMNDLFVNIKVDREERPDVDAIYQQALSLTGQHGGWPLTMFLTPDAEPFWGGTYFPAEPRYGRPGFTDVLRRVSEIYHGQPETVTSNKTALLDALDKIATPPPDAVAHQVSTGILDQIAERVAKEVDLERGGIGGAPKFPQPYAFELLWRAYLRSGDETYRNAVEISLKNMCQGGIYDHLGGGFARYSTDDDWLAPHFEKMLYDNAQLIDLLTLVWQHTREPLYAARIRETCEWVLREMIAEGGGFAATLDADSEGEEGKFYVWGELEINRLLGDDAVRFKAIYDVEAGGNWEGKTILNRSRDLNLLSEDEEAALAPMRQVLLTAREQRIRPGWDDKVLADWNGLMIAAMAQAGAVFDEPTWIAAARTAFDFVVSAMGDGDRLRHSYRDGRAKHMAMLDDYANMARAALVLYEITGKPDYLVRAEAWVDVADEHYWDGQHGGYFFTADDAPDLITRQRSCHDNAVPSGNGVMGGVLSRLWLLTGKDAYRQQADALFAAFGSELGRNFFPMATFLNNAELMLSAVQVVIIGERDDPSTDALRVAVYGTSLPNRVLQILPPGADLPATHPANGKGQIDDGTTAYVCIGPTCSLPLTDADGLRAALPRPPAA